MGKSKKTSSKKKYFLLAITVAVPTVLIALFIGMIWLGAFGPLPDKSELSHIQHHEASKIFASDGVLIGTYHLQNRTSVSLEEVSPVFIDALLAIEDIRFYQHNGIDSRALARVFVKSILLRQDAGGGSTITQQLAKNLYPREKNGYLHIVADKVREMVIARRLESIYSKDEILELYLNSVSFGEDMFGIEMASHRFFNRPPSSLKLHEAATLAGVLRATTWYNPQRNPDRSIHRRNVVIRQMEKYEMISTETANEEVDQPLGLRYNRTSVSEGPAPYFREHLRLQIRQILNSESALDGNRYSLYTDGLIIQTTLDSRMQSSAEHAVKTQMREVQTIFDRQQEYRPVFGDNDPAILLAWVQSDHYKELKQEGVSDDEIEEILHTSVPTRIFTWDGEQEKNISPYDSLRHYLSFLNAGFLAMNPDNGDVLAWVGGIDHRFFQYDHVKASRQAGSAFKPILYSAALESGRKPCDYQRNIYSVYEEYEDWAPRNTREEYGGRYSLQAALAKSINTVAVDLIMETGISEVQQMASAMGIQSRVPAEPSIALGASSVTLLELTAAYTTFLNEGIPATPRILKAIYSSDGELLYDFTGHSEKEIEIKEEDETQIEFTAGQNSFSEEQSRAMSPETAAAMVSMLEKAVNDGTGQGLRSRFGVTHALAGKTGTTQNNSDGWFIGMTPDLVFGAWVGGSSPRVRISEGMGFASQTALPIAGNFLTQLKSHTDMPRQKQEFYPHQLETYYSLDCPDYRDDRLTDRVRDFFRGRSSDEPRVVRQEEEESRNIFRRLRRAFSRD